VLSQGEPRQGALEIVASVQGAQVQEANASLAGLQATLAVTTARQSYYNGLVQGGLSSYETGQVVALSVSELLKQTSQFHEIAAAGLAIIPNSKSA
jgi:hypothetical protein